MNPTVLDISHHNSVESWDALKAAGIRGIIHKASQGTRYKDAQYVSRRSGACAVGLRWGAYHFATNEDPVAQVSWFLANAKPDSDTLLSLDWETNPDGPTMTPETAREFLTELMARTGRSPSGIVIYGGNVLKETIQTQADMEFFGRFPLWLCEYGKEARLPKGWQKYFLWQYSESGKVSGMGNDGNVDLNIYGGNDLATDWTGKPAPTAPIEVLVAHDAPEVVTAPPTTKEIHAEAHADLKENSWPYYLRRYLAHTLGLGSFGGSVGIVSAAQSDPLGTTETLLGFAKAHGLMLLGAVLLAVVVLEFIQSIARQKQIGAGGTAP